MDPSTKGGTSVSDRAPTPSAARKVHAVDELIERATFAARCAGLGRGLAVGATTLAAALLVALLADAAFAFGPRGLLAVAGILLVTALVVLVRVLRSAFAIHVDPRHQVRLLELRLGIANNTLLNALEFERNEPSRAVSAELVRQSIDSGERLAPRIEASRVVDRTSLRRAVAWLPAAPIAALLIQLAFPGLLAATARRLVDPFGFHPAYTALRFAVTIEPEAVRHGKPALIEVAITGPVRAERAEIVFVDDEDPTREMDRVPLVLEPSESEEGFAGPAERFALRIERAERSRTFHIDTPRGRSATHRLEVLPVPSFESATVSVQPPSYTRWPAEDRPLGAGEVVALAGASVTVRATATLPLSEGRLVLTTPDGEDRRVALLPTPEDPRVVVGRFDPTESGRIELDLIGVDGTESEEMRSAALLVRADQPPTIRVIEPDERVFVVEGWSVDVVFEAEDDVGIERIDCVRGVNGFPPTTKTLEIATGDRRRLIARAHFDTAALGAVAGDLIQCFAVAWDEHPNPPHSARSSPVIIEVLSREEYEQLVRTEERVGDVAAEAEQLREKLDELANEREALLETIERVERAERDAGGDGSTEEARADLAEQAERYAQNARSLAEAMRERAEQPAAFDVEKPWQESLAKQAEALERQKDAAQELAEASRERGGANDDGSRDRGQRRATAGARMRSESEPFGEQTMAESAKDVQDLAKLAAAEGLLERVEAVRQAILDQRALADQLAEFRQMESPAPQDQLRMQDLAEEQERIAEDLRAAAEALAATAAQGAEALPKMSAQAEEIVRKIAESNASEDQARAAESAFKGEGRDAHASADHAARKLESLLSDCAGDAQTDPMAQDLDGCLSMSKPGLRQALQQMTQARLGPMSKPGKRGDQPGRAGEGVSGMSATASVVGPHRPQGKPNRESDRVGGDAESKVAQDRPISEMERAKAERIDAGKSGVTSGAGSMSGVPSSYREDVAAYFRRLADEADRRKGQSP
jgi:hypothetical protein